MVQSQPFSSSRLYRDLLPKMKKLGIIWVQHSLSQRRGAGVTLPAVTIDTNLARNHHPASDCSQPFANMPQLPILDSFFFALSSSVKARSPFAEAQKETNPQGAGTEQGSSYLCLGMDERPEGAGAWGRCSSAFRAARGLACAHELPLSDFPTAELQPSPCPCLKNFLNSIPVLFLTALKPHCLYFNKALSGQVTATGLAPASN